MWEAASYADSSDAVLLDAVARHGDRRALHELFDRHEAWVATRLRYRHADPLIREEVVQDTFVEVWRSAGRYHGDGEVAAWIWGIAIRKLLHATRPRKPLLDRLLTQRSGEVLSAEEQLLTGIEHGNVGTAMSHLSPELRAVLQATVLDGLSCREAGLLLGIPTGTVKTRMMRARQELRQALL
jgi:RNA polymerase sigma-70 factor (ECF subfamily)